MTLTLFLCGCARVALVTAYLAAVVLRPEVARAAMVPFAVIVWLIAIYDLWDRRRWGK